MVLDMDEFRVREFFGRKRVTYSDVSSGRVCFTVCFRVSGHGEGRIEKLLVIFQNPSSSYQVNGIPDDIEGITSRSSPKVYINIQLFCDYF